VQGAILNVVSLFFQRAGLGTEYFRILLQSNCGVSVLDFTPRPEGGSPLICLNRLNQVYDTFLDRNNGKLYICVRAHVCIYMLFDSTIMLKIVSIKCR
jgi:hypothetical protein